MKKSIFILLLGLLSIEVCFSQKLAIKDLSYNSDLNYIFSRILPDEIYNKSLYSERLFITIYPISDPKVTPRQYLEDYLVSYYISVISDTDFGPTKLYKIEGLINPKIIEIKEKESKDLMFTVTIEYGVSNKREIKKFDFIGIL